MCQVTISGAGLSSAGGSAVNGHAGGLPVSVMALVKLLPCVPKSCEYRFIATGETDGRVGKRRPAARGTAGPPLGEVLWPAGRRVRRL